MWEVAWAPIDFTSTTMYDSNVKQVIIAKLKLKTTPEQQEALRATQLAYRATLNAVSRYAFEHGKTNRHLPMHRGMYASLHTAFELPSQLACSADQGSDCHVVLLQHGASIGDAKLWYDKPRKIFYLLALLELELVEPTTACTLNGRLQNYRP